MLSIKNNIIINIKIINIITNLCQVYIRGQEEEHHYDEHDYEFCGKSVPGEVKTPGPRLVLLFNAGSKPGSGFKARYAFETGQ